MPPVEGAPGRAPVTAVVALGSNLGDRGAILESAVREIARLPLVDAVTLSPVIESVAVTVDGPDESAPAYLNAVALVTTRLAPSVLLSMLHGIETSAGRERRVRWGDRTLDLDLIAYGDVVSGDPALVLPHPRAAERDFVLGPWLEADPDAVLIGRGRVADLLAALRADVGRSRGPGDAAGAST
jgi:2-amino-4-hydroxy-6-hydroxymethyldihydropteridine diphosphokinase